ncbi:putative membrane protein [Actinacidiphila reveromycinica]|uniref:Putative membrane protein n=1 Tax=Actinacidiphila reveromycinica TaxID=659352 RepID=A0A7U3UU44_9ACTN|nr:YibE/F family protein [Streptomyces sp. SN-593]BBA98671.1 putative membrane protein [Streptomyces sp. SN-593]
MDSPQAGEHGPHPAASPEPGHDAGHAPGHGHANGHAHAHAHGHSHGHAHGPVPPASRHLRKVIAAVLVPFAAAVVAGMVLLWPGGAPAHARSGVGFDQQTRPGKVVQLVHVSCKQVGALPNTDGTGDGSGSTGGTSGTASGSASGGSSTAGTATGDDCQKATIEVESGPDKGTKFTEIVQPDQTRRYTKGEGVVLAYAPDAPKSLRYSVTDVDRGLPIALLALAFALVVVLVGRLRGIMALVALAISFAILTLFILPAILRGDDPLLVAVVGGSAIMLMALYLCHGVSARTSVAVLGTLCSLFLIGALGSVFIAWARLTGNTSDETGLIHTLYPDIEIKGVLLAGVIIGSLGVLDDVTVTQVAAVWELKDADPTANWRKLYGAGMRIGRDHIASVVNTLVMAYAGAALPLLLLFSIARSGVFQVASSELVAEEIVRTLVGSIGLVASVPLTTALAALVVSADRGGRGAAEGPGHGPDGGAPSAALPGPSRPAGRSHRRVK